MTKLLTQVECEKLMFNNGITRAENMMEKAEDKGRAIDNPYTREIIDQYVLPLARAIRTELDTKRAGRHLAHASLLRGLDPEAVAFLAVRTTLNKLLQDAIGHRSLAYAIGKTVHNELVLAQIEDHNPDLYHTLSSDFGRRMSKDERHRMTVFKMQAAKAGILLVEWPVGARDQVGMYLLGLIAASGMVEIMPEKFSKNKREQCEVNISPDIIDRIKQVKSFVAVTMPMYGPCVEPPRDWVSINDGGFHTQELRRAHPRLVRHRLARTALYQNAQMPIVLEAVNLLQRTAWQVNRPMFDAVMAIAKHFNVGEIQAQEHGPKPEKHPWMDKDPETWTDDQKVLFKKWKREMAEWYTERKLHGVKFGRFYQASRSANMFKDYPAIYFVYFADSRGRLYPMTYGLNPQGSDLQKALIHFAKGMPLDTPEAIRWFHVHGANKWGFDKATLEERQQWVVERQDMICSFAEDPVNNRGWTDASDPLQFLAWAMEYRQWVHDKSGEFKSHIPISMDGSCNGLQNLSALLRDEIGGQATNLTANKVMEDIYRRVAEAAKARMLAKKYEDPEQEAIRLKWIAHGISRSVVKRSVMTTPYGVTKRSAIDYVIKDYLSKEDTPFDKSEFFKAATVLMEFAWPAIGDVVVKGREAMDWLQRCARVLVKRMEPDNPVISWVSPSGFPASQSYYDVEVHRIGTRLHGPVKIRVVTEVDSPDIYRHINGLAPNFVHSMDAAHLHLTTSQCARRGIDAVAMIHDDYGTHAANAQKLYEIIREQFVEMYESHDPVTEFVARFDGLPKPPSIGKLNIREVLDSPFFFS